MGKLWRTSSMPIGLDLGASSVRMMQLTALSDGWAVRAGGEYELPSNLPLQGPERQAAYIEAVRQIVASTEFHGRNVVIGLPEFSLSAKSIRMPSMPPEDLAGAVAYEAADRFPNQNLTVQHLLAGDVLQGQETRQEIILLAVDPKVVDACMELARLCRLKVVGVEPTPIPLARGIARGYRREADQAVARVIVDIGAGGTKILILRGHQICFYRRLELGGAAMNEAVARTLNIAPQEAARLRREVARSAGTAADDTPERTLAVTDAVRGVLLEIAKEIGLCLRYFSVTFRGSRPEHVLLTGGEANIPLVHETLAAELGGTVQVAQPLHNLDLSSETVRIERRGHLAQWAVATGLALRSAAGVDAAATSPAVGPATANAARGAA